MGDQDRTSGDRGRVTLIVDTGVSRDSWVSYRCGSRCERAPIERSVSSSQSWVPPQICRVLSSDQTFREDWGKRDLTTFLSSLNFLGPGGLPGVLCRHTAQGWYRTRAPEKGKEEVTSRPTPVRSPDSYFPGPNDTHRDR